MSGSRRHVNLVAEEDTAGTWQSGKVAIDPALLKPLEQLESSKATERTHGIQQIAEILVEESQREQSTIMGTLSEEVCEHIVSWTARILIKESQVFINKHGQDGPDLSLAGQRMASRIQSQYSGHVRHIWIAMIPHVSGRLAKFMAKHITQAFADDPSLVPVLGLDYGKVLRAWVAHPPHLRGCGDKLVLAVVGLCIQFLRRFDSVAESQDSAASAAAVVPGDVEYAATLSAVVSSANPARMAKLREPVMEFCAEFLCYYERENPCHMHIIDTVNAVLTALPDEQVIGDSELSMKLLSPCLHLWSTRSTHTKHSVLRCIRILTRLIYCNLTDSDDGWALLEMSLKTLTTGSWDKFRFMSLPRALLSLWPMVHCKSRPGRSVMEYLHTTLDAFQYGFFDTVGFLAVKLLDRADRSQDSQGSLRRRKRMRTGHTSLSRLLATLGSAEDSGIANARGAAQVVWFIIYMYPESMTKRRYQECYDALAGVLAGDKKQPSELVEWVLGAIRALDSLDTQPKPQCNSLMVWRHALAGVEAELCGVAGLVLDMLCQGAVADGLQSWEQAASALHACGQIRDPDYVQLAAILAPRLAVLQELAASDEAIGGVASRAIMGLCNKAVQLHWPGNLFVKVMGRALGLGGLGCQRSVEYASDMAVPAAAWGFELQFDQVLDVLDAVTADQAATSRLVDRILASGDQNTFEKCLGGRRTCQTPLSAEQWWLVARNLLEAMTKAVADETVQAIPYIAHVVWQAAEFIAATLHPGNIDATPSESRAMRLADEYAQLLKSLAGSEMHLDLVCQALSLTHGWTQGVHKRQPMLAGLLQSLFSSANSQTLCNISVGGQLGAVAGAQSTENSYGESSETLTIDPTQRSLSRRGKSQAGHLCETRMRCFSCDLHPEPWRWLASVVSVVHMSGECIGLATALEEAITGLDDTSFLVACEFISDCVIRAGAASGPAGQKLVDRALGLLDSDALEMPTMHAVLVTVARVVRCFAQEHKAVGDDLARFIAWLAVEAKNGRVDVCVETAFIRLIVGPWSRNEHGLGRALSALEGSGVDVLTDCVQMSPGFGARLAAEAELAGHRLRLKFITKDGAVVYEMAGTSGSISNLVTRDLGLAMLVARSQCVVPGALVILLKQLTADMHVVSSLCHRLLAYIAETVSGTDVVTMCSRYVPELLRIDRDVFGTLPAGLTSGDPEFGDRVVAELAVDRMLEGDFARAGDLVSDLAPGLRNYCLERLFAHALVISAADVDRYAKIREELLVPKFTSLVLEDLLTDRSSDLVFQLLRLVSIKQLDIGQLTSAGRICAGLAETQHANVNMPQWSVYYGRAPVIGAIEHIARAHGAGSVHEYLTGARVCELITRLHLQLAQTGVGYDRQRLLAAVLLLIDMVSSEVAGSEVVQISAARLLVNEWGGAEHVQIACACLLLDRCPRDRFGQCAVDLLAGMADSLLRQTNHSMCFAEIFAAVIDAVARAYPNESRGPWLMLGSALDQIAEMVSHRPGFVVTVAAVRESDDRMGLADIAECATRYLRLECYASVCAEILVECTERLLQLTVPEDSPGATSLGRLDLAVSAVVKLAEVKQAVDRHIAGFVGDQIARERVLAPLMQSGLLLEVFEQQAGSQAQGSCDDVGDGLPWLVCRTFRQAADLEVVCQAINAAVHMDDPTDKLGDSDRRIFSSLHLMRSIPRQPQALRFATQFDDAHLLSLCPERATPSQALCQLTCSLASRPECTGEEYPLGLLSVDPSVAGPLLPQVLNRVLRAGQAIRSEVAGFLLDLAHNWREESPQLAREIVARMLQVRRLDAKYADIREFLQLVPLPLFELAALASRLDMPETAVFLLECDLTCSDEARPRLDELTSDARALLMTSYQRLGNQAAARLLTSVATTSDVMRRCWNQADWRTLLMYQEAAGSDNNGLEIGSTLVQLGMLTAVAPESHGDAAFASAWRLAKWEVPGAPVCPAGTDSVLLGGQLSTEQTLFNILSLRAHGQTAAAERAARQLLVREDSTGERRVRKAVGLLMPLIANKVLKNRDLLVTARIVRSVLDRVGTDRPGSDQETLYLLNLALHEISVCDAMAQSQALDVPAVFAQYKAAALQACNVSRRAHNWQTAMNHVFRLKSLAPTEDLELRLWEAEVLWEAGSRTLAIEMLTQHRREITAGDRMLLARVTLTIGEWMDCQRIERPAVLWEDHFKTAAALLHSAQPTAWTSKALHVLATFAERQCEELLGTMDDEAAIAVRMQKHSELRACELAIRESHGSEQARLRGILRRLEAQVAEDEAEVLDMRSQISGFLRIAVWAFARCLESSGSFDSSVYPLVSLLMTHASAPEMAETLAQQTVDRIASAKFLPLAHQLCARLSTDETPFHLVLRRLVYRMAVEYPYHIIGHLFALRNANRTSSAASSKRRERTETDDMEEKRCKAAQGILLQLKSTDAELRSIVDAIDQMCEVYIELAVSAVPEKYRSSKLVNKIIGFGSKMRISRLLHDLPQNIPVFTARPTIGVPGDYTCVPFISSMSEGYSLAGGINLPKILRLLGSDGQRYKQLVKGKDDMRQDAVIEQLFQVINNFMAPADRLHIRTYMVVPLTKRCGVLQWVDSTIPFGEWFRENEPKYRPDAPTTMQMRAAVHNVHKQKDVTPKQKLDIFSRVCAQAPPIFRFFFYSMFYDAQTWFERRDVYIRSAAVSSMAGWALGIGDRHLQNILVDTRTAELVHIDLGIAFDLGRLLPVPELVPFRLTREMQDGMGMFGLEATFKESCRVALSKMRENARVVITILNVLKVDPLYMWSLIPLRRDKIERTTSTNGTRMSSQPNGALPMNAEDNKEASRSILHVGKRLNANISVEGQVNELIQQATDPNSLSRMFEGWSAWY